MTKRIIKSSRSVREFFPDGEHVPPVTTETVRHVCELSDALAQAMPDEHMVANGFAHRMVHGTVRPVAAFTFNTPQAAASAMINLPATVGGVPVLVECGPTPTQTMGWLSAKAQGGVGIRLKGNDHYPPGRRGTLGCIVQREGHNYALTCEHVLADGASIARVGADVLWQRGRKEKSAWHDLGRVAFVNPIDPTNPAGGSDSALVTLECPYSTKLKHIGRVGTEPFDAGLAVALQVPVVKCGASTGLTYGRVRGMFTIKVTERDSAGQVLRKLPYKDALEVWPEDWRTPFCRAADSGAVFWESDVRHPRPVGLLCSTAGVIKAYAVPMARVLEDCQAQVLGRA